MGIYSEYRGWCRNPAQVECGGQHPTIYRLSTSFNHRFFQDVASIQSSTEWNNKWFWNIFKYRDSNKFYQEHGSSFFDINLNMAALRHAIPAESTQELSRTIRLSPSKQFFSSSIVQRYLSNNDQIKSKKYEKSAWFSNLIVLPVYPNISQLSCRLGPLSSSLAPNHLIACSAPSIWR